MSEIALPHGWETKRLGELCLGGRDGVVDGPFGSNLKRSDFVEIGIPVLKLQNVKPNRIVQKNMDYVTEAKYHELSRHSFVSGDIVMTKLGDPLGVSAIVADIARGVIVADLVRIRPGDINTRFLCHQLNSPLVSHHLNKNQKGTTRPRINLSIARDLCLHVPPLEEQERIVEILEEQLSRLDAAVKSVQTVREKAAQFRRSLLHAAFAGELLDSRSIRPKDHAGVTWKTLSQVGESGVFIDGDWVESKDQDPEGGIRLTQLADVGEGRFRDRSNRWLRKDQAERLGVTYLNEGDLLIARMPDPLGRCCQVPKLDSPAVTVVDVAILRVKQSDVNPRYLMWILNSPSVRREMLERSSGTTRTRISRKNLGQIQVPLPPPHEQQKTLDILEEQLSRLEATLSVADEVERKANALRRSLLHAAFTGELTRSWREAHV